MYSTCGVIATGVFLYASFCNVSNRAHPHLAHGVREGQMDTMHWRLILETEMEGVPTQRVPLTPDFYKTNNDCIDAGEKADVKLDESTMIRCLPYRNGGDDTPETVPQESYDP